MNVLRHCPSAPDWEVNWEVLRSAYPRVEAMHSCPQDAIFHAEGDVGIHTRMACEALAGCEQFRALPATEREVVFAAVLLHDVAKPDCTKYEGKRITSRGHSNRGDIVARQLLWRENIPFRIREQICGLIRHHQVPFFLVDREDSEKLAYRVSQVARCDHLAFVAWADGLGRRCADDADQKRILDNVALFREFCDEHECLDASRQFPSDHSRFLYFQKENRDPNYLAHDDTICEVTLMSGLPGAGKDEWIRNNAGGLPLVSLDAIRSELKIDPGEPQGRVIDEGRQRARMYLRQNQSFVWNATNLSWQIREQLIGLFASYNARIRIVYVEVSEHRTKQQNRNREDTVPTRVMERLLGRWTVPNLTECHQVVVALAEDVS